MSLETSSPTRRRETDSSSASSGPPQGPSDVVAHVFEEALSDALLQDETGEPLAPGDQLARETLAEVVNEAVRESVREEGLLDEQLTPVPVPAKSPNTAYVRWGKRTFDLAVVIALMPLWLPLYVVIALALLAFQGHPVHYRATRPGRNCKPFTMLKFRTMHTGADRVLARLLEEQPQLAEEFKKHNKLHNDPRRTVMGRFLRRTSLDEIPQFWNVLFGHMTLVGPRPPATQLEHDTFYATQAAHMLQHRPGLTGLWQVSSRSLTPYERKIWLDLIYAKRCSFKLDVKILLKSIPTVLRGYGAF